MKKRWVHHDLYGIWQHMHARCYDPKAKGFKWYGARGIKVCERWHNFQSFLGDVLPRPKGMTLDRPDTNNDYGPENFRWSSMDDQIRNRRYTIFLTHQGETLCIKDWARKVGISYQTLRERIRRGWPHDLALITPPSFRNSGMKFNRVPHQNPIVKREHWPTECPRGHALTPDNSRYASSGKPYCKICERARGRLRAGWPEELAYSMEAVPHGHRPVCGNYRRNRLQDSAGGAREDV